MANSPTIKATPKTKAKVNNLTQALGLKEAEIVEMAIDLLQENKKTELRRYLESIDLGSALFTQNAATPERHLCDAPDKN